MASTSFITVWAPSLDIKVLQMADTLDMAFITVWADIKVLQMAAAGTFGHGFHYIMNPLLGHAVQ